MNNEQITTAYELLKKYTRDEDTIQDVILKLLQNPWDESKSSFKTWVTIVFKTTNISRLRKVKELNLIEFETEDGKEVATVVDYMQSDESSWLDDEIVSEEKEELLNRLKMLSDDEQEIMNKYFEENVKGISSTKRMRLHRAMKKIINKEFVLKYKFFLVNIETGEKKEYMTQKDIANEFGISFQSVNYAFKKNKLIEKKYKIEKKS